MELGQLIKQLAYLGLCGQAVANLRHYEPRSAKKREACGVFARRRAAATVIIPPDKGSCLKSSLASAERRRDLSLRANARVSHANPPELNRLFIVW